MDSINRIKRGLKKRLKKIIEANNDSKDTKAKETKAQDTGKKHPGKKLSEVDKYYIGLVVKETGWTFNEAKEAMKAAKRQYKIKYADYAINALYKVPEEELEKACISVKEKKKQAKEKKEAQFIQKR